MKAQCPGVVGMSEQGDGREWVGEHFYRGRGRGEGIRVFQSGNQKKDNI